MKPWQVTIEAGGILGAPQRFYVLGHYRWRWVARWAAVWHLGAYPWRAAHVSRGPLRLSNGEVV